MSDGAALGTNPDILVIATSKAQSQNAIVQKFGFIPAELNQRFGEAEFAKNYACAK